MVGKGKEGEEMKRGQRERGRREEGERWREGGRVISEVILYNKAYITTYPHCQPGVPDEPAHGQ